MAKTIAEHVTPQAEMAADKRLPLDEHASDAQTHALAGHHDHPSFLAHHFDSPQQQFDAGKLGMWLFLATEVLLFGGLFCGYSVWRGEHPEMFKYGSQFLDTKMGAINTAVLILSSLTMAAAVTAAQKNDPKTQNKRPLVILLLCLTLCGAAGFMVIKYFEYTHKFHEGWYPGMKFYEAPAHAESWNHELGVYKPALTTVDTTLRAPKAVADLGIPEGVALESGNLPINGPAATSSAEFDPSALEHLEAHEGEMQQKVHADHPVHPLQDPMRPRDAHMFFNIYFMMTGLHGIHVIVGAIVIVWVLIGAIKGRFSREYFTPVDLGGLYWHIVDLIWIFLFPLFYLI